MLGNDVIDLRDEDARPASFAPRFDERVFSPEERRAIARDRNPVSLRWAHWAAKESAYKLAKQLDSTFVFAPRRLVAFYEPISNPIEHTFERHGTLTLPHVVGGTISVIELRSFETSENIHVVAIPAGTDWGGVDHAIEKRADPSENPSVTTRAMAIREISRRLGVRADRITIGRRERIPTILLDGARTSLSLSLSHHGDWIGYAMQLGTAVESPMPLGTRSHDSGEAASGRVWS